MLLFISLQENEVMAMWKEIVFIERANSLLFARNTSA
jgi:hypothetical protein